MVGRPPNDVGGDATSRQLKREEKRADRREKGPQRPCAEGCARPRWVVPTFVRAGRLLLVEDESSRGRVRTAPSIERTGNAGMGRASEVVWWAKRRRVGGGRALRYLVVFAHPDPDSFSGALCASAVTALRGAGHHVDLIDLYAEDFDPRMTTEERRAYESPTPILSSQIETYAQLVRQAEGLVFVYPTWWWGLPAILKGWLDRVLVPGVSFVLDPRTNKVKPGLGQLRHVVGISTYGSSRVAMRVFNDAGRRNIMRCVRVLAHPLRCRSTWLGMYALDRSTPAQREAFLTSVTRSLGAPR